MASARSSELMRLNVNTGSYHKLAPRCTFEPSANMSKMLLVGLDPFFKSSISHRWVARAVASLQ